MIFLRKILYITIVSAAALYSQVKEEPKERNVSIEEPVIFKDSLPKIELPDFVITGKEKIEITDRNKIEVFNDRLYSIPEIKPDFEQKDIPVSEINIPLRKGSGSNDYYDFFSGFVHGAYGNFNSPAISAGAAYGWDIFKTSFSGSYLSREENVSYSDFSTGKADITIGAKVPETNNIFTNADAKLDFSFYTKKYNYYGWRENFYLPIPPATFLLLPNELNRISLRAGISSEETEFYRYKANLSWNNFQTNPGTIYLESNKENTVAFDIAGSYNYEGYNFEGKILINNLNLSTDFFSNNQNKNLFTFGTLLNAQKELMSSISIIAGVKFYSFGDIRLDKEERSKNAFLPQFVVKYENNSNLSVSAGYTPNLKINSLQDIYSINPYTRFIGMSHLLNKHDINANIDYFYGKYLRIKGTLGYLVQENTPIFSEMFFGMTKLWMVDIVDQSAKGIYARLRLDYYLNPLSSFVLNFAYQDKKMDSQNIPYEPKYVLSLDYFTELNFGLKINPAFDLVGDRYSFYNNKLLKPIFILKLNAEYPIFKNLSATLNLNNILNTNYSYFEDYEEYPFSVFGGVKFKW